MRKVIKRPRIFTKTLLLMVSFSVLAAASAQKKTATPSKSSVAEGAKLFKANCQMCHAPDKDTRGIGPGLKGLFKNKQLPESHKPATESNIRDQILEGNPTAKPMPMPAFKEKLKPEQIDSLIQYLKTL